MEYFIKKTKNLEISYTEIDKNLINYVETCIQEVELFLQKEYSFRTFDLKILICPTVEEYILQTGKSQDEYESWMIGCSLQEQYKIVLLSPTVIEDSSLNDLLKIAKHEMVHFMFDSNLRTAKPTEWISEGIAIFLAGQNDLNYVSLDNYPKIEQITKEEDFADYGGYEYAGIYVWYFIEKYGKNAFLEVYQDSFKIDKYLYSGYEYEAIYEFKNQNKI